MSPLAALRDRLRTRTDSEHEQAILRIVLVGFITAYMWERISASSGPVRETDAILLFGLAGFFILAIAIFAAICIWPASNIPRRVVGMLADAGAVTFPLFLAGDSGVGLIGSTFFLFSATAFVMAVRICSFVRRCAWSVLSRL
jgi:two-component system, sensor histidine kinase RpfC